MTNFHFLTTFILLLYNVNLISAAPPTVDTPSETPSPSAQVKWVGEGEVDPVIAQKVNEVMPTFNMQLKGMDYCIKNPNDPLCQKNFESAFGPNYQNDVTMGNIKKVVDGITSTKELEINKKIDTSVPEDAIAYVRPDSETPKVVTLAPKFTSKSEQGIAGTFIHELSHLHDTSDTLEKAAHRGGSVRYLPLKEVFELHRNEHEAKEKMDKAITNLDKALASIPEDTKDSEFAEKTKQAEKAKESVDLTTATHERLKEEDKKYDHKAYYKGVIPVGPGAELPFSPLSPYRKIDRAKDTEWNADSYKIFGALCQGMRRRDIHMFRRALLYANKEQREDLLRRQSCQLPPDYFAKKKAVKAAAAAGKLQTGKTTQSALSKAADPKSATKGEKSSSSSFGSKKGHAGSLQAAAAKSSKSSRNDKTKGSSSKSSPSVPSKASKPGSADGKKKSPPPVPPKPANLRAAKVHTSAGGVEKLSSKTPRPMRSKGSELAHPNSKAISKGQPPVPPKSATDLKSLPLTLALDNKKGSTLKNSQGPSFKANRGSKKTSPPVPKSANLKTSKVPLRTAGGKTSSSNRPKALKVASSGPKPGLKKSPPPVPPKPVHLKSSALAPSGSRQSSASNMAQGSSSKAKTGSKKAQPPLPPKPANSKPPKVQPGLTASKRPPLKAATVPSKQARVKSSSLKKLPPAVPPKPARLQSTKVTNAAAWAGKSSGTGKPSSQAPIVPPKPARLQSSKVPSNGAGKAPGAPTHKGSLQGVKTPLKGPSPIPSPATPAAKVPPPLPPKKLSTPLPLSKIPPPAKAPALVKPITPASKAGGKHK